MSFFQLRSPFFQINSGVTFPTVTTQAITSITATSGDGNGTLVDIANSAITARGFVYSSTTTNPTLADSVAVEGGTSTGTFTKTISGLSSSTLYYVRAYATNAIGTAYGDMVSFTTSAAGAATAGDDWPAFQRSGFWNWRYA